jgi:hypothetical protein
VNQALGSVPGASEPIRVIRPVVVPVQFFVWGPIIAGFLALFPTSGFLTFGIGNGPVVFGLAFAVILGLIGLKAFYEPALTSYAIYPDRIEFEEGLFNRQRRTVLLDKIIDVH